MRRILAGLATLTALSMISACFEYVPPEPAPTPSVSAAPARTVIEAPKPVAQPITYPEVGSKKFTRIMKNSKVMGKKGRLRKIRLMVEKDITGPGVDAFYNDVIATLSDKRSWIGTGWRRFQVTSTGYDLTIYLATPATRDVLCGNGYDRETSCYDSKGHVILNAKRWATGNKYYEDLVEYRKYMINHEVGHYLGQWHQKCPGEDYYAPIMQQQTLGLHGCVANPYPLPEGELVMGPAGEY